MDKAQSSTVPPVRSEGARRRREILPDRRAAFGAGCEAVFSAGALGVTSTQLSAGAVAHVTQRPHCIEGHTRQALAAGPTAEAIVASVWVAAEDEGTLLGASFIAVPASFLARSIDLPRALDVGRQTFRVIGWGEVVCAPAPVAVSLMHDRGRRCGLGAVVSALVCVQVLVLRLRLDRRIDTVAQGTVLAAPHLPNVYGELELCKRTLLDTIAWVARPPAGISAEPVTVGPRVTQYLVGGHSQ